MLLLTTMETISKKQEKTFKLTNGELHEAIHHTIKVFEAKKNFRMTNNRKQ